MTELVAVTEETTWDFSTAVTLSSDHSGDLKYADEAKNVENIYANIPELTFAETFKADALAFTGEYPFRSNKKKFAQNGTLHFKAGVSGKIKVSFTDTGSGASATAVKRYLVVNDVQTEYWTSRENNGEEPYAAQMNVTTGEIAVAQGDVTIKGSSAICVSKVQFIPDPTYTATFENDGNWAEVYAYVWSGEGEGKLLGDWPGTKLEASDDGYVVSITGDAAPEKIIFNNGAGSQTGDLAFEDGAKYNTKGKITEGEEPQPTEYFVVGSMTGWATNDAYKMVANEASDGEYMLTTTFAAGDELKVVSSDNVWYPDGMNNNYVVTESGEYTVYFRPAGNAEWANGFFNLVKKEEPIGENDIVIKAENIIEGNITAALTAAMEDKETVGNITINLSEGVGYKVTSSIVVPNSLTINGNGATIDASRIEGDNKQFIVLNGTTEYVTKPDNTKDEAHLYIEKVDINNVTITGMPDGIIRDNQKTLLKNLTIDNCNIQVPNKVFVNFTSKGYVETLAVTNSTIWSADNGQFFVQYGSRLKNIAGAEAAGWLQTIDVENSTFYHIANGKNICDFPMNSQTCNVYTLKNNVFVDCGKSAGQVVVGFNKGGTSANPVWMVSNNLFNYDGVDTSASEVSKAGKKNDTDIVQKSVAGIITFTDAANGDFNALVTLSAGGPNYGLGDPRWTVTFGPDPVALANPEKLYIMGSCVKDWSAEDRLQEMTYDEEKGVFTYELVDMDKQIFFTIGDVASFTDWLDFNFWHRYAYERQESHEQKGIIGEATQLYTTRGEGTINLPAGDWIISISKADGKMTITPKPVVISSMAIVGDLTGGWPNGDDWSMAKAMTQDAENSAIWTLTVNDVEVEAKTYYYKATANGKWGDYELPSQGNNEFIFGTEEYPAGKYNLTFVANTEQNTLTLTAERVSNPDGISSVKTVDLNDAPVFNLNGQRVNKAQKGLFIVGGKKVVIK